VKLLNPRTFTRAFIVRDFKERVSISETDNLDLSTHLLLQFLATVEPPVKLTTSGRGKLTTCFAGEDFLIQVC
jgi:hypothetical protein